MDTCVQPPLSNVYTQNFTDSVPDIFHSDQGTEFMAQACVMFWGTL